MDIGRRIKSLRTENQMTQKQLAEKVGLTPKMISFYEKGERIPPLDIVEKLVKIFSKSSDYIIGIDNLLNEDIKNNVDTDLFPISSLTAREQDLIQVFRQLTNDNQDIIIGESKKYLKEQRYDTASADKRKNIG